ncbi:MAG TPA: VOC family protein [Chryseolinea sp.]|nr:VOC family protein [Chryseolinea sp.]
MPQSPLKKTNSIKLITAVFFALLAGNLCAQTHVPGVVGKNFLAMTVSDADSTSQWYQNMFGVKLLKEIKPADGSVHIRIEGNEFLMVEILEMKESRNIVDCNLKQEQAHLLQGFFKAGLFVRDAEKVEQYFKSKGIAIPHPLFHDKETATSSFILEDPNGNMLQFIEDENSRQK